MKEANILLLKQWYEDYCKKIVKMAEFVLLAFFCPKTSSPQQNLNFFVFELHQVSPDKVRSLTSNFVWFRLLCLSWMLFYQHELSLEVVRTLTNSNVVVLPLRDNFPEMPGHGISSIFLFHLSGFTCSSMDPAGVAVCLLWRNLETFSRQLRLHTKMTNMATPRRRLTALTATPMFEQTWAHRPWLRRSSFNGSKVQVRPRTRNSLE